MELENKKLSSSRDKITIWKREDLNELSRKDPQRYTLVCDTINRLGIASAKAQGLGAPVTNVSKLLSSDQRLYVYHYEGTAAGILKVGIKKLFVNIGSSVKEISPLCILDIYVLESLQRNGIGKILFDYMLRCENVNPSRLAYDRPSQKLLPFLSKHFGLKTFIPQTNNFVVFNKYFETDDSRGPVVSSIQSIQSRPLTSQRSRRSSTPLAAHTTLDQLDVREEKRTDNSLRDIKHEYNSNKIVQLQPQPQITPKNIPRTLTPLKNIPSSSLSINSNSLNDSTRLSQVIKSTPLKSTAAPSPIKSMIQSQSQSQSQSPPKSNRNYSIEEQEEKSPNHRYKHTPQRSNFNPITLAYDERDIKSPSPNSGSKSRYSIGSERGRGGGIPESDFSSPSDNSKKKSSEYHNQFYGNQLFFG